MVSRLPHIKEDKGVCEACLMGKQQRDKFPKNSWRASMQLELVHTAICGPMQIASIRDLGTLLPLQMIFQERHGCTF